MRLLPAATLLCAILAGCSNVPLSPAPVRNGSAIPVGSASQPAPAASAPAALPAGSYRVQPGDTLRSIARRFGVHWQDLVLWNQLANPNLIEVGQVLRVVPPGPRVAVLAPVASASASKPPVVQVQALPSPPIAPLHQAPVAPAQRAPAGQAAPPASAAPHAAPPAVVPAAAAAAPRKHEAAGGLQWSWPARGRVVQGFNGSTSKGLDIAGVAGEPVRAAAAGKVVYAGNELRGFGNLVILKNSSEYISVYAHNQKLLVRDGQQVHRGQVIALMGSSDAQRTELHFEIRLRGKPVDPLHMLPAR